MRSFGPSAAVMLSLVCSSGMNRLQGSDPSRRNEKAVEAALPTAHTKPIASEISHVPRPPSWKPARVDDEKVTVLDGVACSTTQVLDEVTHRVTEFVANMNRIAATERVVQEDLNSSGKVVSTEKLRFDYVASISTLPSGELDVEEFRNAHSGPGNLRGIATLGLPALAIVFHERYRLNYDFKCEGLGEWEGRATWLLHFRQRHDRPSRFLTYIVDGKSYPVGLEGRAWIAADSFQIMRMEADVMNPVPKIQLREGHQVVEYKPFIFHDGRVEMWLPVVADLYFDVHHRKWHRKHSFDSYVLFSVTTKEKIGMPAFP